ncbi:MAG: O-antigen ligase family protein [Pirellulaceae bacterium]
MDLLLIAAALVGLVFFLALSRHLSMIAGCVLVLLIGVTFGHPFFNIDFGPIPLTLDRVLWGWLILALLVLWKLERADPKPLNRTDMVVLGLAVLLIVSTLMHDWRYKENLPMSRLLFFNLIPIGFYFLAKHCRLQQQHLVVFYAILALFGLYLSITGICEQRGWYALVYPRYILDPVYFEFFGRARGPLLNPVSCGVYLVTCLMASVFLWPQSRPLTRVFLVVIAILCGIAAYLTLTRSIWLSLIVAAGLLAWLPSRQQVRGVYVVVGTLLMVLAVIQFGDKINRFQRDKFVTAAEMEKSATLRPMLAWVALKMFRDKPLAGHGFGQYTAAKKPYHFEETADMPLQEILGYMQHNVFLSYATETGLTGLILLVCILSALGFKSWQLWSSRALPMPQRQLGMLGMGLLASYLINGMFHDVSIIPHIGALLFLVLGAVENVHASQRKEAILGLPNADDPPAMSRAA